MNKENLLPVMNEPNPFFKGPSEIIKNSFQNKKMIKQFVKRDFKNKYRGSLLGYFWSLLAPFMQCMVYYLLIVLWRGGYERKPLWLFGGILAFGLFRDLTKITMDGLTKNIGLIKKLYFPRELFAVSTMFSQWIILSLSLIILIPLLLKYGFTISFYTLLFPLGLLGITMIALGIGWMFCCANAAYSDIGMTWKYIFTGLFFGSPILWRIEDFFSPTRIPPEYLTTYFYCNPLAVFLTMFRYGLDGVEPPLPLMNIVVAFTTALVLLLAGMCIFKRYEAGVIQSI
ncbi:MAG: ABC transporter permease [Candidatus Marinimicrobia bacterium]|nr:ABC transporter permease [Candidatus Neomarinimicrobiota bacterium]